MLAPYAFGVSTYELWVPLLRGGHLVLAPPGRLDVGTLRRLITEHQITAVHVTGDLRTARVYYLVFGKDGPDPKVQRGLESAAGFLRNALSRSLMIRYTPTLSFELDTSIEHGVRLTQLIDSVNRPGRAAADESRAGQGEDQGQVPHGGHDEDEGHVVDEGDPSPEGR